MKRLLLALAAITASAVLAACGQSPDAEAGGGDTPDGAPAGMCAPDAVDCDDTSTEIEPELRREDARALLGMAEGELDAEVRVSRRGDEHLMLTEDYRIGRMTVELDADADGVFRVSSVVLELEDGPETFSE